jgi:hypothetical protein
MASLFSASLLTFALEANQENKMPMKHPIVVIVCSFTLSCTHITHIPPESSLQRINKLAQSNGAVIKFQNGQICKGKHLKISSDSTTWIDDSDQRQKTLTSEVHMITFNSHGKGAMEGLGLGMLFGGTAGAVLGYTNGDDPGNETFSRGEMMRIRGVVMGVIGGATGTIFGLAAGSTERFILR